jgi:uncharacterized protein (TIGR03083 family)
VIDHLAHLRADADAVLAALSVGDPSAPVAACPGWTLRDLVVHLGGVHRWARQIVSTGELQRQQEEHEVVDLAAWFAEGAAALLDVLAAADPAEPCWSFTTDRTKGFWRRRQALETVVHRWDAEHAVGEPGPIDPVLAADGVAEVVDLMAPRQVKLGRIGPLPVAVELRALEGGRWVLGEAPVSATVTASAEVLLLLLWHRVDPGDPRVRVDGDDGGVLTMALAP